MRKARPAPLTLMSSLVSRGQATFSFHFLTKHVTERPERLSWESCRQGLAQCLAFRAPSRARGACAAALTLEFTLA